MKGSRLASMGYGGFRPWMGCTVEALVYRYGGVLRPRGFWRG